MFPVLLRQSIADLTKLALLGALALLPSNHAAAITPRDSPISVMVVGDSISQGRQGDYTWRYRMWEWFTDNHVGVNIVGPYTGTREPLGPEAPAPPLLYGESALPSAALANGGYAADIDNGFLLNTSHFAIWGRSLAEDVPLISGMVSQHWPELLLIELGFNDIGWFISDAAGTLANMEAFISSARAARSDLKFAIANVPMRTFIGGRDDLITKTEAYNALLAASIPIWSTAESPIYLVDFRDNYSCEPEGGCPAGTDGLHPDALGEFEIAKAFVDTLHFAYGLGNGPLSIPVRPCPTPSNVAAVTSVAGVTVTWNEVYGAYGYSVQFRFVGGSWSTFKVSDTRYDTTWTVAGVTWQYTVQAYCGNEVSGWTDIVQATADPVTAPGPSNIWVTPTADGIDLTWDAVQGYDVDLYGVYNWDTTAAGAIMVDYGFTGTSASLTGLTPGDHYVLAVETWATVDGTLAAGMPSIARGAVAGGEPEGPTNFQVVTINEGATVQMTWDAMDYAYGYRIWTRNIQNASDVLTPGILTFTETCAGATYLFPGAWNFEFCVTSYNGNYESVLTGCTVAPEEITTVSECPVASSATGAASTPTVTWEPASVITPVSYAVPTTSSTTSAIVTTATAWAYGLGVQTENNCILQSESSGCQPTRFSQCFFSIPGTCDNCGENLQNNNNFFLAGEDVTNPPQYSNGGKSAVYYNSEGMTQGEVAYAPMYSLAEILTVNATSETMRCMILGGKNMCSVNIVIDEEMPNMYVVCDPSI
jgi:lysophospholipase L1-like esterase